MIDVTMTACRRPEILLRTLYSFGKLMMNKWKDCRLIINIDPVGVESTFGKSIDADITDICANYFKEVIINFPESPSFPKAFKWCWLQTEADFILNLEDDWELLRLVHLDKIINILKEEDDLALIRLPIFPSSSDGMKNWTTIYPWNGKYFETPSEKIDNMGFCGHPSIIKGEYIRSIVHLIDTNKNPEKQFHSRGRHPMMEEVRKWRYGVWGPQNSNPAIKDIGRRWIINTNWRKKGTKAFFTIWEEQNET